MQSLIPTQPGFFNNFIFSEKNKSDSWAALLQPDGGSINMEASYNYFYEYATNTSWNLKNAPIFIED